MTERDDTTTVAEARTFAGCIQARHARENGALVVVIDNRDGRWQDTEHDALWLTICERHGECLTHGTRRLALWHAPNPTGWCEGCRDDAEAEQQARLDRRG